MSTNEELIPPPPIVREKLARNIEEGRLLRDLLRLSVRAAEHRHQQVATEPRQPGAARPGGVAHA